MNKSTYLICLLKTHPNENSIFGVFNIFLLHFPHDVKKVKLKITLLLFSVFKLWWIGKEKTQFERH